MKESAANEPQLQACHGCRLFTGCSGSSYIHICELQTEAVNRHSSIARDFKHGCPCRISQLLCSWSCSEMSHIGRLRAMRCEEKPHRMLVEFASLQAWSTSDLWMCMRHGWMLSTRYLTFHHQTGFLWTTVCDCHLYFVTLTTQRGTSLTLQYCPGGQNTTQVYFLEYRIVMINSSHLSH